GWDLEVFDRWGQVLFRSDDPSKGWDGEGAIPGVYAFRIRYSALGAAPRDVLGSITLVR
ncbi:MAG: gliding motility-associated C-terminal domain-containing protein, partial [Flavobacteriales bacterium]|nr:gliding motility-associated C-terminal domain-containing protein [Flavobacteriales bacterium]